MIEKQILKNRLVKDATIGLQFNTKWPKPAIFTGMVEKRKQHGKPVIRALLALHGETHVGVSALLVAGFVFLATG